jgi:hypothetical protein
VLGCAPPMKATAPTIDRVALGIVIVASLWFAFAAAWGMFGIPGSGHIGAGSAGNAMAAEQMVRWKIGYPAWGWYSGEKPQPGIYLCHHPFGQYYVPALLFFLLGHHDWVLRLPAVLMSAAMPPLLYGIGKARWGAPLGAVAAAGYTVVPIAVGFSNFWNLETIGIFGALLFFWGHSRHMVTLRRRDLAASLIGLGFACSGDWVGYLLVAPTLGWAFVRAFVLPPRLTPYFRVEPYAKWWALSVLLMLLSLLWWVWLFHRVGQISEWLNAGDSRGGGDAATLRATLDGRKAWIEFSFTPLAIAIGKIAAPICLLRVFVKRWDEETYAPGLLFGSAVQYVVFKQGADVHTFWPHYFAAYFALALAQLAGAIAGVVGWLVRWFSRSRAPAIASITGLVLGMMPVAAMAHDGVKSLWVWRRTGGRYDDNGSLIRSQIDLLYVVREVVLPRTPPGSRIDGHPSAGWYWEYYWSCQSETNSVMVPSAASKSVATHPFWIARSSGLSGDEQRNIASRAHVRIYGEGWVVDQREPAAPLDAYSLNEREPNPFQWLLYGGTEPARSIGSSPDPWLTWEWRTHLGQPSSAPSGTPVTLDQIRIAHNIAVASGDGTTAEKCKNRIEASLDRSVEASFTQGVHLLGVMLIDGAEPRIESWFEFEGGAGGKGMGDAWFGVRSTMEGREPFSLIPPDPTDRDMSFPPSISTKLWRPGFIYAMTVVLNHRIGIERYTAAWRSRDGSPPPTRTDRQPQTTLAVVP